MKGGSRSIVGHESGSDHLAITVHSRSIGPEEYFLLSSSINYCSSILVCVLAFASLLAGEVAGLVYFQFLSSNKPGGIHYPHLYTLPLLIWFYTRVTCTYYTSFHF